jgi:hypothetical protein
MAWTEPNSSSIPLAASHCSIQILKSPLASFLPEALLAVRQNRIGIFLLVQIECR